jgi:uncharacterized membrane protein YbaN (DUF454 family)
MESEGHWKGIETRRPLSSELVERGVRPYDSTEPLRSGKPVDAPTPSRDPDMRLFCPRRPVAVAPNAFPRRVRNPLSKAILITLGSVCLGVGIVGIFLPLLPGTPLILLGAACWARSSTRLYDGLCESRLFGPTLRDWRDHRSLRRRAKWTAVSVVVLSFGASVALLDRDPWLRVALAAIGVGVAIFLARLPTRERQIARGLEGRA